MVGVATDDGRLVVEDPQFQNTPVEMDLSVLLGKPPRMTARGRAIGVSDRLRSRFETSRSRKPAIAC